MSDTPRNADECKKLLDNGWSVVLFKNGLGSYTAVAVPKAKQQRLLRAIPRPEKRLTDDFEPSQVLYRVTEKVLGNIV